MINKNIKKLLLIFTISILFYSCSKGISEEQYTEWYINGRIIEEQYRYSKDSINIHKLLLLGSLSLNLEQINSFLVDKRQDSKLWIRVRQAASERFKKMLKPKDGK